MGGKRTLPTAPVLSNLPIANLDELLEFDERLWLASRSIEGIHMNLLVKIATVAACGAMSSQPCFAAAVESEKTSIAVTMAATAAHRVDFNLKTHAETAAAQQASQFALATSVSANAAAVAQEAEERDRPGMSKGVQTALIVGGVAVVAVLLLAVVVANTVPPGP